MAFNIESFKNRPVIGAVKMNKPFTYHNSSFECAAWWEDQTATPGVYPIQLRVRETYPHQLYISAEVAGKITNDYFPGLWGGVAVSNEPYKPKLVGTDCIIRVGIELVDAIEQTGWSPDSDKDWFIHPSWWKVAMEESLKELREHYERLPEFWNKFAFMDRSAWKPSKTQEELRWSYDSELNSRVGMVAYMGGIEKWGRRVERLSRKIQSSRNRTEYSSKLWLDNTAWADSVRIQHYED